MSVYDELSKPWEGEGGFAGDLVGILEKNLLSDREWKERLEDLLVVTLQCVCVC